MKRESFAGWRMVAIPKLYAIDSLSTLTVNPFVPQSMMFGQRSKRRRKTIPLRQLGRFNTSTRTFMGRVTVDTTSTYLLLLFL